MMSVKTGSQCKELNGSIFCRERWGSLLCSVLNSLLFPCCFLLLLLQIFFFFRTNLTRTWSQWRKSQREVSKKGKHLCSCKMVLLGMIGNGMSGMWKKLTSTGGEAGPITRKGFSKNVKLGQQTVALGVDEITEWN